MMKLKRKFRIGAIIKELIENPNKIISLNYFTEKFDSAKSTISEDIDIIRNLMDRLSGGSVDTIIGASGGVKYAPYISDKDLKDLINDLKEKLAYSDRIIPGGFIYTLDILYDPKYLKKVARFFYSLYAECEVDYILTVETKGIPLATMVAEIFNVPLVIARDENKLTEGSTIGINYVSGSRGTVRTMFISKRSIKEHSNVLIVDDFMRGGGTAKGMSDLVLELKSTIVGRCFLIEVEPDREKLIDDYDSLVMIKEMAEGRRIVEYNKKTLQKLKKIKKNKGISF